MGKDHKKRKSDHHGSDSDDERKQRKAEKKVEKLTKMFGYTNEDNPFGDSNLSKPFVWKKKEEKQGSSSSHEREDQRLQRIEEIGKIRKRREDRENELAEMERLRDEEQRLRELASYGDWKKQEEDFLLEQIRVRSVIRILESRESCVDCFAKLLILSEALDVSNDRDDEETKKRLIGYDADAQSPVELVELLNQEELDQLYDDVDSYLTLENMKKTSWVAYWQEVKTIVNFERKRRSNESSGGIHSNVVEDVKKLMQNKNIRELDKLQDDIDQSLRSGATGDRDYWERVKREVKHQRALAFVSNTLQQLRDVYERDPRHLEAKEKREELLARQRLEKEDESKAQSTTVGSVALDDSQTAVMLLNMEKEKGFEDGESAFQCEELILAPSGWTDNIERKKPQYFNRVRTGYDWNKYNNAHYDRDNPPPRMIQGYRFTIFYPELADSTRTPKYFLEAADDKEYAIIRFHAGPPYEDVAFKILNKHWDRNPRSNFKCLFDRGILHLHFNFKRAFYKR